MRISAKFILVQIMFMLILFFGCAITFYFYAIPKVEQIETQQALKDLSRVKYRIDQELDLLTILATDWGVWDATYIYVNDRNKAYEQSNFTPNTLTELEMDFIFIVSKNGDVIWKQFSSEIKKFATAEIWQKDNWSSQHPFIDLMSDQKKGIIYSNLGPLLVSGSKITPSLGGDSRGNIFFGKMITNKLVTRFSQDVEFQLELSTDNHRDDKSVHFISQDYKIVHGLLSFANSNTKHLTISLTQPRPFFLEAMQVIKLTLLTILGFGTFSSVVTFIILKKIIINPIKQLRRQSDRFGKDQSSIPLKPLNSSDELGKLSISLVNMANELKRIWGLQEHEKNKYLTASYTDPLTKLKNRRYMEYLLNKQQIWIRPTHWSFLMLDIDNFKKINDKWGHQVGDTVLQQFSALVIEVCRGSDIIFRLGGEEFLVVCEWTNQKQSCEVVERIRKAIESAEFGPEGNRFKITCSLGFFAIYNKNPNVDWNTIINLADCAMYAAKNSGRNTWVGLAINEKLSIDDNYELPGDVDLLLTDIVSGKLSVFFEQGEVRNIKWQ